MGCASAKPKRTTSIEDVAKQSRPAANQVPDKNGQVSKAPSGADKDRLLRDKDASSKQNSETKPIEIPGAHLSFMAPDGIPFIDEDVEGEGDDGALAGRQQVSVTAAAAPSQVAKDSRGPVKVLASPDQNKNVTIIVNKEPVAAPRSSALRESNHPDAGGAAGADAAGTGGSVVVVETSTSQPAVVTEIKKQEIHITSTKTQPDGSTEVRSRTIVTDVKPRTEEELAATRIQAGIRGYLDRQKVKAIRANMQHPSDGHHPHEHEENTQSHSGPKVTVVEEHVEWHSDDPHDPKLDAAATKIQASYKGYKTRKKKKVPTATLR